MAMSTELAVQQMPAVVRPDTHVTDRRVLATIVDGLILGGLYTVMAAVFGTITQHYEAYWTASMPPPADVAFAVVVLGYYLVLESYRGQTLGKVVAGIRVVDEVTGDRPAFGAVLVRTILRLVDGIAAYLVAFVTVLLPPNSSAWVTWRPTRSWCEQVAHAALGSGEPGVG
jgi:uncharacterized RDD family membrane protein YckC